MHGCGYVHSMYAGGMVDGPGIRYVVFLAGCPLRCKYCHNPDTWNEKNGTLKTVEEVVSEILKYKKYYTFSKGGVSVSGGEPLHQPDFVAALLAACKTHNLHTVLDTSGFAGIEDAEKALAHTDLLLLDIKSINPEVFKKLCGVELDKTLEVLRLSRRLKIQTRIRFVLVPGYTDNINDIQKMAEYLRDFDNIEKVDVLPFHKTGEYKWKNLGLHYELTETQPPSPELLQEVQRILTL